MPVVPDEAATYGYVAEDRHFVRAFLGQGSAAADLAGRTRSDADPDGGLHERRTGQDARVSAARAGRISPGGCEGQMDSPEASRSADSARTHHHRRSTSRAARVVQSLGLVRGIVVRSRSVFGNIGAGIQTILRRQHHALHIDVRAGARECVRHHDGARAGGRRQRRDRHPVRCDRDHVGRDRSALLRDGGGGSRPRKTASGEPRLRSVTSVSGRRPVLSSVSATAALAATLRQIAADRVPSRISADPPRSIGSSAHAGFVAGSGFGMECDVAARRRARATFPAHVLPSRRWRRPVRRRSFR